MKSEFRYSKQILPEATRHSSNLEDIRVGIRRNEHLFEQCIEVIKEALVTSEFHLQVSTITSLHAGLFDEGGGLLRVNEIFIKGTTFIAPPAPEVPDLLADMCLYVNNRLGGRKPLPKTDAIHVSAYALWRTNWIHPFADGNGAVARALCYILLSVALDSLLPGIPTIPEQIADSRGEYYLGLESADRAWRAGVVDTSRLEHMIDGMLNVQLLGVRTA